MSRPPVPHNPTNVESCRGETCLALPPLLTPPPSYPVRAIPCLPLPSLPSPPTPTSCTGDSVASPSRPSHPHQRRHPSGRFRDSPENYTVGLERLCALCVLCSLLFLHALLAPALGSPSRPSHPHQRRHPSAHSLPRPPAPHNPTNADIPQADSVTRPKITPSAWNVSALSVFSVVCFSCMLYSRLPLAPPPPPADPPIPTNADIPQADSVTRPKITPSAWNVSALSVFSVVCFSCMLYSRLPLAPPPAPLIPSNADILLALPLPTPPTPTSLRPIP